MIRVLVFIPWFSPSYLAGGPVQSVLNLVSAKPEGIEFRIFCGDTDLGGRKPEGILSDQWVVFNERCSVFYATRSGQFTKIRNSIKTINPSLIYIVGIFSPVYNLLPLVFSSGRPVLISPRGMLHPGALSKKSLKKQIYLHLFDRLVKKRRCGFHVSDDTEAGFVMRRYGNNIRVVPVANLPNVIPFRAKRIRDPGRLRLITVALISPMKNHLAILRALGRVVHDITYDIVGPVKDEAYWRNCLEEIGRLPQNIKVHYHGAAVPSMLPGFYYNSDVFICPSESENFGHAFYEALSSGCPVITSCNTPWNGLQEAKAGLNVPVDPAAISAAIDFFAEMPAADFEMWSRSATDYAKRSIDIQVITQQYEKLFSGFGQ